MPRASGKDLCEIFGYAPDDRSEAARKQWKSQRCPFVDAVCCKHSHPREGGETIIYGACSVVGKGNGSNDAEEVIICPRRLYQDGLASLKHCVQDALGKQQTTLLADEYTAMKRVNALPDEFSVLLGQLSGKEINVRKAGGAKLSYDWVIACQQGDKVTQIVPCEVQSIDITGNYRAAWDAYATESASIPNSGHGMNWANVWKRLIPQLLFKAAVTTTSTLCKKGLYFIVPELVFRKFEEVLGEVPLVDAADNGVISVFTYELGTKVPFGQMRGLAPVRTARMRLTDLQAAFTSGDQLPSGSVLDTKVLEVLQALA